MAVTDSFVTFVLEQLDPLGPIASKRMFGGVGIYSGDLFLRADRQRRALPEGRRGDAGRAGEGGRASVSAIPKSAEGHAVLQRPGRDPRGRRGAVGVGEGGGRHRQRKQLALD